MLSLSILSLSMGCTSGIDVDGGPPMVSTPLDTRCRLLARFRTDSRPSRCKCSRRSLKNSTRSPAGSAMASCSTDSAVTDEFDAPPVTRARAAWADAPDSAPRVGKPVGGECCLRADTVRSTVSLIVRPKCSPPEDAATGLLITCLTGSAPIGE